MKRKSIGFAGQRIVQIPRAILEGCRKMPLINTLFIVKMGVYPKALYHYYKRPKGITQTIILYCTDGTGWIQIGNNKLNLVAGDVFIIPPGTPHSYGSGDDIPWTIYWFHLSGTHRSEAVTAVMQQKEIPDKAVHVGISEQRILLFDRIEQALLNGYSQANLMFANLSVAYFITSLITPNYFAGALEYNNQDNYTAKAISFMQKNLTKPNSLPEIAASAHLSVSFFSRHFKKQTGYSPVEYFNHLKIQKACQLLHLSNLRVNEVALQIGMEDPLYFSRLFKKLMGLSPAKYRKAESGV